MRIYHYLLISLLVMSSPVFADQFCFALAQTVYEQIYCELEVKAQIKGLPSFNQFKKNNEHVQASLLKRPAERNGIKLPLLKKAIAKESPPAVAAMNSASTKGAVHAASDKKTAATFTKSQLGELPGQSAMKVKKNQHYGCELINNTIQCDKQVYQLLTNKHNRHLAANALTDANKMNLPEYQQGQRVSEYLSQAYAHYIDKMCAIGLCGVTMTYGKFSFLYRDIQSKGLNFSERFELMYGFLKKDKNTMGVSESAQLPTGFELEDCDRLDPTRFACAYKGRNYIFENK